MIKWIPTSPKDIHQPFFLCILWASQRLTVCWYSSPDCSHEKASVVRKRRHFLKPALNVFCVAQLQRERQPFPLSNTEGWYWCGPRTWICHRQEWMPTPEWLHCLHLIPHYLSSNIIATNTRNPDPEHVPAVLWGICHTRSLLQAGKWQSYMSWDLVLYHMWPQTEMLYHQRGPYLDKLLCHSTPHHNSLLLRHLRILGMWVIFIIYEMIYDLLCMIWKPG